MVGDLALALVGAGVSADEFAADPARFDIPESVIGFLRGELGDPPGGWPEPLRTKALAGRRAGQTRRGVDGRGRGQPARGRAEAAGHPQPPAVPRSHKGIRGAPRDVRRHLAAVGQPVLLRIAPRATSIGCSSSGVCELLIGLEAISEADERGMRTVMCIINGQLRPVVVRDRSIADTCRLPRRPTAPTTTTSPRRSPASSPSACPSATRSSAGQTIATIEAMKMEAAITAPEDGHRQPGGGRGAPPRSRAGTCWWCSERSDRAMHWRAIAGEMTGSVAGAAAASPRSRRAGRGRPPTGCASRCSTSWPPAAT